MVFSVGWLFERMSWSAPVKCTTFYFIADTSMNYYYICIICTYFPLYIVLTAVFELQVGVMISLGAAAEKRLSAHKHFNTVTEIRIYFIHIYVEIDSFLHWNAMRFEHFKFGSWMFHRCCHHKTHAHSKQWVKHLFTDISYMQYFPDDVVSMYAHVWCIRECVPVHSSFCNICCIKTIVKSAFAKRRASETSTKQNCERKKNDEERNSGR